MVTVNFNDVQSYDNGLGLSFKSIGNFISKNVKSAVKDTGKVAAAIAPIAQAALSFVPGGSIVGGVIGQIANTANQVQTVTQQFTPQQAQAVQEISPVVYTQQAPIVLQPTQAQVAAISQVKNIPVSNVQDEVAYKVQENVSTYLGKEAAPTTSGISPMMVAAGGLALGAIVYLVTKNN